MSILEQLSSYLSQPPDSIVYHIVTLLALQATLGLAWWQARRRPDDDFARRLTWASGIILLSRLFTLLALFATSGLVEAIAILPPLERAVDALTVALLVWALAPQPRNLPFLNTALLLILVIVIALMSFAFINQWRTMIAEGFEDSYVNTQQSDIWNILQMVLLAVGGVLVLLGRESQWSLRLAILVVLFVAHALSLLLDGTYGTPNVEVSFWVRTGNVVAFPMLAVLAYRHNVHNLLPTRQLSKLSASQLAQTLGLASEVAESLQPSQTAEEVLSMAAELLPARLVALVLRIDDRPQHLQLIARTVADAELAADSTNTTQTSVLRRDDWPSFAQVMQERRSVELMPNGSGARQLHELSQELRLGRETTLLMQPLFTDDVVLGLLLIASQTVSAKWSEEDKAIIAALSIFVARALDNAHRYQSTLAGQAPDSEREVVRLRSDLQEMATQRDQALDQASALSDQLTLARERHDANHRKLRETTQALALAAQRQSKVLQLEQEVTGLREALSEAELALAYAAAGEAGLSTEWVMRTVTRYSGELEEAQARISALQDRLNQVSEQALFERAASITGQLRTPLTALGGYTDLLLDESAGDISPQQESLLRRMRVNVENMTATVDSLSARAETRANGYFGAVLVDLNEAIDEAIYAISDQLQAKKLKVNIYVEGVLPPLQDPGDTLQELLVDMLTAACLVSSPDGRIDIRAKPSSIGVPDDTPDHSRFLNLAIADEGGQRSHALYANSLGGQGANGHVPASAEEAVLAKVLNAAMKLASASGGRCWLDFEHEVGSTLSLLLPLAPFTAVSND